MALGTITPGAQQGQTTMRPNFHQRVSIVGDGAYPTGGTTGFAALLNAALKSNPTILQVAGYGFTAGAITHIAQYDATNDTLKVFVLAGTEVVDTTDLSAVTFDLVVTYA